MMEERQRERGRERAREKEREGGEKERDREVGGGARCGEEREGRGGSLLGVRFCDFHDDESSSSSFASLRCPQQSLVRR